MNELKIEMKPKTGEEEGIKKMMGLLDMMEELADKKYKVFIRDNQPIFCDNIEIKNDLVYCTDFDCEDVLMIPLIKVDAIKEYREKGRV